MLRVFNSLTNGYSIQNAFRQRTKKVFIDSGDWLLQESKKQSGMCAAHAEVIMITHIKLLHDNLLEKNPHFSFKFFD